MAKKSKKGKGSKTKGRVAKVDFTGVSEGGRRLRLKEEDYPVKVIKAELGESQAGNSMITLTYEFLPEAGKKAAGKKIKDRFALTENAIWRLYNFLTAIGRKVPKEPVNLNIDKLIGEELGVTLEDEEYDGKMYSRVADYMPIDELGEDEDEDEDDDEDEDEDDDDEDEDDDEEEQDYSELSEKELIKEAKSRGIKTKGKKKKKLIKLLEASDESDDDEEEDDEDLDEVDLEEEL